MAGGEFYVPSQNKPSSDDGNITLEKIISRDETHFTLGLETQLGTQADFVIKQYPSHGLYSSSSKLWRINPSPNKSGFLSAGHVQGQPQNDFGIIILRVLRDRIYRFDAQRVGWALARLATTLFWNPRPRIYQRS